MTRNEISELIKNILVAEFEIEPNDIHDDVNIYEDLDIDSIDAVDLIVKLRKATGKAIEPGAFLQVETINDLVNVVEEIVSA